MGITPPSTPQVLELCIVLYFLSLLHLKDFRPPRNIGVMYCVMFCLRLSGIEMAPLAPHPQNWNYALSFTTTRNIGIMYCVMFCLPLSGIEKAPFTPHQPCQVLPLAHHVLELCIVLGLTIIAFSVETKPNNTTIY